MRARAEVTAPLVSVCLPTRNRAGYLQGAIRSVLAQTMGDLELIVSDNASTDDTAHVARDAGDPRLRYVRQSRDLGVAGNWERAVGAATGRYCIVVGDDDGWAPELLERLVAPLERDGGVDLAFCDHWVMNAAGRVLPEATEACSRAYGRARLRAGLHRPFAELAVHDQAVWHSAALVRRARIAATGALDPRAGLVVDYYFFSTLALGGGGAFYVPERLAYYRRHARSIASTAGAQVPRDLQWACARLSRQLPPGALAARIREKWAVAAFREMLSSARAREPRAAARALVRAVRVGGFRLAPWLGASRVLARAGRAWPREAES